MHITDRLSKYSISHEAAIGETLRKLDDENLRFLLLTNEIGKLVGTITFGDINRWI